jgi:SAM-dependent methyltransferase
MSEHQHQHAHTGDELPEQLGADFWNERYSSAPAIWSGRPNPQLVAEVAALPPGRALDVGCGEGADAIWLAGLGWDVTAVDVSQIALDRAAAHAAAEGVTGRVRWQQLDLGQSFPEGTFTLVTACFLHSFPQSGLPREAVLRRASAAVAPGGVLLIAGHAGVPPWPGHQHGDMHFPSAPEVLASLKLPDGEWDVLAAREHERIQTGPDGQPYPRVDNVLKVRRR